MKRTYISTAIAATLFAGSPLIQQAQAQVLEEVIVTAQKREQSANDIGISVTAFSNEQMGHSKIFILENFCAKIERL